MTVMKVGIPARMVERLSLYRRLAAGFLDGVNAAAVALMAAVGLALCRGALVDGVAWAIELASALVLVRWKVNATWLIVGGAGIGILVHGLR